jgi:hypothetical protein
MRRTVTLITAGALALAACGSLEGDGEVVTENRTVANFNAIDANNGVQVLLTVDPAATGDVVLAVTTDSNLQEFLTTKLSGTKLTVSSDRTGGVTPSEAFNVSGSVAAIVEVSVDNGAQVEVAGPAGDLTLSADNGARIKGEALEAATVSVNADNGAQISVCATGVVTGDVTNGARLTVHCGGSTSGVETSDGGRVSSAP